MSETLAKAKRPNSIGIICAIGLLWAILAIPLVFSPEIARQHGSWYPSYLAFSIAVGMVCVVGLWFMRKWAVYTYIIFAVIDQVVRVVAGVWNIVYLLMPAVLLYFAMRNISRMR